MCTLRKRLYAKVRLTKRSKNLARLFVNLNLLRRIHKHDLTTWRLFPSYNKQRKDARAMRVYNLTSSKKILSVKALRILNINCPFSYCILETSKGLMTHKMALKHKIGGFLICIIL